MVDLEVARSGCLRYIPEKRFMTAETAAVDVDDSIKRNRFRVSPKDDNVYYAVVR